eukprot:7061987-Pyramimonas_sp.AAC.1
MHANFAVDELRRPVVNGLASQRRIDVYPPISVMSDQSCVPSLTSPTMQRNIRRFVLASFSTSFAVKGAVGKPYNAVGATMMPNSW